MKQCKNRLILQSQPFNINIAVYQQSVRYLLKIIKYNQEIIYFKDILIIETSSYGLSVFWLVLTIDIFCTVSIPRDTRPNTVCLLSSHGVGITVMKNWLPLVFGPRNKTIIKSLFANTFADFYKFNLYLS